MPYNIQRFIKLYEKIIIENVEFLIIGNGSNIVASSKLYEGIVISLKNLSENKEITIKEINDIYLVSCFAGVSTKKLCYELEKKNIIESVSLETIPGTIGGVVKMNASFNDFYNDKHFLRALVIDSEGINFKKRKDLEFSYRHSNISDNTVILYIEYIFDKKTLLVENIEKKKKEIKEYRKQNQPINRLSAGSTFKNPQGLKAWELITLCKLNELHINGAKVSDIHANFIINENKASGEDIYRLMNEIKYKVLKKQIFR